MKSASAYRAETRAKTRDFVANDPPHFRGPSPHHTGSIAWNRIVHAALQHVMLRGVFVARNEFAYAQQEVAKLASQYRKAAMFTVAAAGLVVCGIFALLSSLVLALSNWMETWAAFLWVGLSSVALGFLFLGLGKDAVTTHHSRSSLLMKTFADMQKNRNEEAGA